MSVPKYNEMFREFLNAISDGEVHQLADAKATVIREMSISDEDINMMLPSGKQKLFDNRIGWCITYLKKAGLVETVSRAHFKITDDGKKALASGDPITEKYLSEFKSFRDFIAIKDRTDNTEKTVESSSPEEILEDAWTELNNALASDLMDEVMKLSSSDFETLVVQLLLKMGYGSNIDNAGLVTQASNDGGIDGIIKEDQLGFSSIYIQAKQWKNDTTIDRPEINKFVGALMENLI